MHERTLRLLYRYIKLANAENKLVLGSSTDSSKRLEILSLLKTHPGVLLDFLGNSEGRDGKSLHVSLEVQRLGFYQGLPPRLVARADDSARYKRRNQFTRP